MKKYLLTLVSVATLLALSGCAQFTSLTGIKGPGVTTQALRSDAWNSDPSLKASSIAADLLKVGYCLPQASDFVTPDPSNDYGKAWAQDQVRSCNDYAVAASTPGGCQLTYNVSVGKDNLFDPKRPLIYEDSMSVLLLYGENWQVEMTPARGTADPIKTTVANCNDYVQKLIDTIGGNVNRYGQYK
jgi:hypothetical protein